MLQYWFSKEKPKKKILEIGEKKNELIQKEGNKEKRKKNDDKWKETKMNDKVNKKTKRKKTTAKKQNTNEWMR